MTYTILESPDVFNWEVLRPGRILYEWRDQFGITYRTRPTPYSMKDYEAVGYKNRGTIQADTACAACHYGKHRVSPGKLFRAIRLDGQHIDSCTGSG